MTSYNGRVFFGLNADLDSVGDVHVLADLIEQEVAELVETARLMPAPGYRRSSRSTKGTTRVRVYLPATTTVLRTLVDEGRLPGPHTAFAVTPHLRRVLRAERGRGRHARNSSTRRCWPPPARACGCWTSIRSPPAGGSSLAADVPDDGGRARSTTRTPTAGAVRVEGDIGSEDVASAHLDGAEAEDDVQAAVAVVLEADLGSEDAQFVVDQAEGHELAWYATQEIGPALELL